MVTDSIANPGVVSLTLLAESDTEMQRHGDTEKGLSRKGISVAPCLRVEGCCLRISPLLIVSFAKEGLDEIAVFRSMAKLGGWG